MTVWMRSARERRRRRASERNGDNRLAFMDQASFLGLCATGQGQTIQCVWVYRRPIDLAPFVAFTATSVTGCWDGVSSALRCRSPAIGGSAVPHRWISMSRTVLGRAASSAPGPMNADNCPLIPSGGPVGISVSSVHRWLRGDQPGGIAHRGRRRRVLPGGSRCGPRRHPRPGYPPPASRTRRRAVIEDAAKPHMAFPRLSGRCAPRPSWLAAAATQLTRAWLSRPVEALADTADADESVVVPAITIHVDVDDWDARAYSLGGASNSLLAGFTAKLAEHAQRLRRGDGAVLYHSQSAIVARATSRERVGIRRCHRRSRPASQPIWAACARQ